MKRTIPGNSRWLKSVPELTFFSDPADRSQAMQNAFRTFHWHYVMAAVLVSLCVGFLSLPLCNFLINYLRSFFGLPRLRSVPEGMIRFVVSFVLGAAGVSSLFTFFRRRIQRSLRQQLLARGTPICLKCGYDLRASKDRCPECGEPISTGGVN